MSLIQSHSDQENKIQYKLNLSSRYIFRRNILKLLKYFIWSFKILRYVTVLSFFSFENLAALLIIYH
jgi:hypothetical protein